MTLKKISLSLIILFSIKFYSQEQSNDESKSIITLSTLSPAYSYAPRWNLGYIKKLNERYWVGIDFGYGNQSISVNFSKESGLIDKSYTFYEVRPEIYYDLRPKKRLKHLLSTELFYINHRDKFKNGWFYDLDDKTYYTYDFANYKRLKYGINLNYNLIYNISKNFALMQKIGFGFRQRNVEYSNVVNKIENEYFEEPDGFIIPIRNGFLRDNGIQNGFNFNLDLKIIYKF